jgi:hypothetical protein
VPKFIVKFRKLNAATLFANDKCALSCCRVLLFVVRVITRSGEVPNLYPPDERAEICEKMRQLDRQRDKTKQTDGSPVALFNMFVQRCRNQLHVILAMSPIGDAFRNRLRKFPSLVNCCTIDWFKTWPADALEARCRSFVVGKTITISSASPYLNLIVKNITSVVVVIIIISGSNIRFVDTLSAYNRRTS